MDNPELALALIIAAAATSQLLAARLSIPAIVPLLAAGVLFGPYGLDIFDPEDLLGDLLQPMVALAVGVILFEGGLALRARDLRDGVGKVVLRLITLGVAVTWALVTAAAILILDIDTRIALILGAILTLSGPTVVLPIVEFVKPTARLALILRWEGILIDPVGAILAVLTFGAVVSGDAGSFELGAFLLTLGIGAAVGLAGAFLLAPLLRYGRSSHALQSTAMLGIVFLGVAVASTLRDDAGLVAAIAMGIALTHIHKQSLEEGTRLFTEALIGLLIGTMFIVLSAGVDPAEVADLGLAGVLFVLVLVVVIRPLVAFLCTFRTRVPARERLFIAGMMPRGIVAAATVAAFAPQLAAQQIPDAEKLVPITFLVIAATVVIYGMGAKPLAAVLGVDGGSDEGGGVPPPSRTPER